MIFMTDKKDWNHFAELLRAEMAEELPPIRIEKVMQIMGYSSKNSAEYALIKFQAMGVVKWINGKWYMMGKHD